MKLYKLFNLKNQNSGSAIEQFKAIRHHPDMFAAPEEIRFADAPVIIASGGKAFADEALTKELKKHIALAKPSQLYSLSRIDNNLFAIAKTQPDESGIISSYHPSYLSEQELGWVIRIVTSFAGFSASTTTEATNSTWVTLYIFSGKDF